MLQLEDRKTYVRADGTWFETVGGATRSYPEYVWTIAGNWYERASGKFVHAHLDGSFSVRAEPHYLDLVKEVPSDAPES